MGGCGGLSLLLCLSSPARLPSGRLLLAYRRAQSEGVCVRASNPAGVSSEFCVVPAERMARWTTQPYSPYVQRRRAGWGMASYGIMCAIFLGLGIPWLMNNIDEDGGVYYDSYGFWLGVAFTVVGAILGILFLVTLIKFFKLQMSGGGDVQNIALPTQQIQIQVQPQQAYNQNYNQQQQQPYQPYPQYQQYQQYGQQQQQQQPYSVPNQQQSQWRVGVPVPAAQASGPNPNENMASAPLYKL